MFEMKTVLATLVTRLAAAARVRADRAARITLVRVAAPRSR